MPTSTKNKPEYKTYGVVPKGPDVETHVRVLTEQSLKFIELRDFFPSSQTYGRGNQYPITSALDLAMYLELAWKAENDHDNAGD